MNTYKKNLEALTAISQISNNSKLDYRKKLQEILFVIITCMNSKKGSIMLTKGRNNLEIAASTNSDLIGTKQPVDEDAPSVWVLKNKLPCFVNDNTASALSGNKFNHYTKDAFILVPILSNNKVIGVISVTEKIGEDRFSHQEKEMILTIASHIISALENHRLSDSLKKNKQSLKQKNIHLKKLEKLRTELFNMLIHDLKGPISEIIANIDILSYTVTPDNMEYVEAAQSGCDSLYRMISDLLDISRFEERSFALIKERIAPDDLISEAISRLHGFSKIKEIQLIKKTPPKTSQKKIPGDRSVLLRVLQNLIINAIYHSPKKDSIDVGYDYEDKQSIVMFVRDNGPGVPLEFQTSIFNKFVHITKINDGRTHSTGLGLTFCKLAVEAHKGTIYVESDGKKGSCFKFILKVR